MITNWVFSPFALSQGLIAILTIFLALVLWRRRGIPGSRPLSYLLIAVTIWALMAGLDAASVSLQAKIFWSKIEYVGICASPVFVLLFVLDYTNQEVPLRSRYLALLWAPPVITFLLALTNEYHHLIWKGLTPIPGSTLAIYEHGLAFWLYIIYSYSLLLLSFFLLLRAFFRYPSYYHQQAIVLILATVFPWLGNFVYITNLAPGYDLTPTGFSITALLLSWAIYSQGLFQLTPIARENILEWMEDGFVVLDSHDHIVDLNQPAERVLMQAAAQHGLATRRWVGQTATQLTRCWPGLRACYPFQVDSRHEIPLGEGPQAQFFDLHISLLSRKAGQRDGLLLLFHEITHLKQVEQEALHAREIAEALYDTGTILSASADFSASLEQVLGRIREVLPCDGMACALGENGSLQLACSHGLQLPPGLPPPRLKAMIDPLDEANSLQELHRAIAARLQSIDPSIVTFLASPIIYQSQVTGMLAFFRREATPFTVDEQRAAASLATQISIAQANMRMFQQVQHMASTDGLTGLYNRRHFFTLTVPLFEHSVRYQETFSVIMFDLDNFKEVNDTYGHLAGDEVLRALSSLCLRLVRHVDIFARYGGEEFVVALPRTEPAQAGMIAERIRLAVERNAFTYHNQSIHITISLGVASSHDPQDTLESVLEQSDQALYLAKQAGRNCVRPLPANA
jgi:diguanylate cyclase (GGDEF)-like protein